MFRHRLVDCRIAKSRTLPENRDEFERKSLERQIPFENLFGVRAFAFCGLSAVEWQLVIL